MTGHFISISEIVKETSGILNNPMELSYDTIGKIIRWYNGRVKFECSKHDYADFAWQARFHDHIIRNGQALERIRHISVITR